MNRKKRKSSKFIPKWLVVFFEKVFNLLKRTVLDNPVLVLGLSLGPVIAISQSLKAGVSLSVAFSIIIVPVLVIFGFIPVKLPKSLRIILCSLLSCVFFVPAFWFAKTIFPEVNDKVGIFLPLMVVNPIISSRSSVAIKDYVPLRSMLNGLETALSFSLVMCIVSLIREIIGTGTVWDKPVLNITGNISFLLPFMGFIIVGFLAAGVKKLIMLNISAGEVK